MTSADPRTNPDNFCYRHPDRQSFVLCQRCLRTICPECQTPLPVGVICPECLAEQQKGARSAEVRRMPGRFARKMRSDRPIVTYAIMIVTVAVYLVQLIPVVGGAVTGALAFAPPYVVPGAGAPFEPWRMVTVALVHSTPLPFHVALNMLALWALGRSLEPLLGKARFLALYVLSAIGGSVLVALIAPGSAVVGASGAVWGLLTAMLIIGRHVGANMLPIAILLGINLVFSFVGAGVSWQSHIGGGLVGLLVGFVFARTRAQNRQKLQALLLVVIGLGLVALAVTVPGLLYL
ncbi:rhomboid family intramembrane serine protease [Microbacterium sp. CnD16-F]|uniref:rhomboid family intramembrane serine protease n=1 Tax=Microbacterium sp. CnD16-F TaxID=2954493 RepID=UPI0020973240|nr:rhomboid family intramembrane serine protease [Microbacterium sp. CnD16-F]MCO7203767.1 rhomboid family intramembrane serine protease [Microbacterium sp. CnD16-F]